MVSKYLQDNTNIFPKEIRTQVFALFCLFVVGQGAPYQSPTTLVFFSENNKLELSRGRHVLLNLQYNLAIT
jgi:hypothetical protein